MHTYLAMLDHVLTHGKPRRDRTGVGTIGVFGYQNRYNLNGQFPLLTTKRIHTRSVFTELLWLLRGDTNTQWMRKRGVTIWDEWADPNGDLGPVYGQQWRAWPNPDGTYTDQISALIDGLTTDPFSRRHIVNAWNVAALPHMALPPCHMLFQFHVEPADDGVPLLNCELYQRSADIFLGVPFNVASYAALTYIVAALTGMRPGEFIHSFGDLHLYLNHRDQAALQLSRTPRPSPQLTVDTSAWNRTPIIRTDNTPIDSGIDLHHFHLTGYNPHPTIPAPVAA